MSDEPGETDDQHQPVHDLNDLWSPEYGDWKIEHSGYGSTRGEWRLILSVSTNDTPYDGADDRWVEHTWMWFADTVDDAVERAVAWCWALVEIDQTCNHCGTRYPDPVECCPACTF